MSACVVVCGVWNEGAPCLKGGMTLKSCGEDTLIDREHPGWREDTLHDGRTTSVVEGPCAARGWGVGGHTPAGTGKGG